MLKDVTTYFVVALRNRKHVAEAIRREAGTSPLGIKSDDRSLVRTAGETVLKGFSNGWERAAKPHLGELLPSMQEA